MTRPPFQFGAQLRVGDRGEQWLSSNYHELLTPYAPHDYDFVDAQGRPLELKTESRSLSDTPNFFVERWSDLDKQKPGGPWQSLDKGVQVLVYLFYPSQTYFVFEDIPVLIDTIISLDLKPKIIQNVRYRASGFVVPRSALAHLYKEYPSR